MNCETLLSNMATIGSSCNRFLEELRPTTFRRGDNLERFIKECEEYFEYYFQQEFDVAKKKKAQVYMTKILIDRDLRDTYMGVDSTIIDFQERLRIAFGKKSTILEDLQEALTFRQTSETVKDLVVKVNEVVDKIMKGGRLNEEDLKQQLLVNWSKEKKLKKNLCLSKVTNLKETVEVMERLEEVRMKCEPVQAIAGKEGGRMNYRDALMERKPFREHRPQKWTSDRPGYNVYQRGDIQKKIECWTCHKEGHMSRDCTQRKIVICYHCQGQGHMRKECPKLPNIECGRCRNRGHRAEDCRTNLQRFRNRDTNGYAPRPVRVANNRPGRINAIEEDGDNGSHYEDHPNDYALTEGEIVGALH